MTQPREIRRYGWIPDQPDERDHLYAAPPQFMLELPASADLRPKCPPVYDQGTLGSCTANAIAGAIEFDRIKQRVPDFVPSRLFIYYNERVIEGDVANDAGARLRDGIKSLQKQGVCPEPEWRYDDTPAASEGGPFPPGSRPAMKPTSQCYKDAAKYEITSYQRLTPVLSQLQGCLASGHPFVFGFSVFSGWYFKKPRSSTISLPGPKETLVGGHAVMCVGYDNCDELPLPPELSTSRKWSPTA